MALFKRSKTLDERYLELRELAEEAQHGTGQDRWGRVQDLGWELLKDCMPAILADDARAPIVALAAGKISLIVEAGTQNWHRVASIGYVMSAALAKIDQMDEVNPQPGLLETFASDLYRNAEITAYAAHRAGLPTAAAAIAEGLTSVRLGDRTLHRSIRAWEATASEADRASVFATVDESIRAAAKPLRFTGGVHQLDAFYQKEIRSDFARIDRSTAGGGARVALSYGTGLPLEAMRLTGRSLLYVGAGVEGGVAVVFDSTALDDPDRPLAASIELPGVDILTVAKKIAELHAAATARRERTVSGTELSALVEDLLAWLGSNVWRTVLDRWPELRDHQLAVIPLGEFAQLPLYTAVIDDHPVCATLDITIAPSARSLILAGEHPAASSPQFVAADPATGDDELYYVMAEAEAVARVHNVQPQIFRRPTTAPDGERMRSASPHTTATSNTAPDDLVQAIRSSAIVHLACHGHVQPREPLSSALLIGGRMPLDKLLEIDLLPGSTIVLSACDLASIGIQTPGEQLGFPAVLLAGGARSVVAALWPVPDSTRTVRLMTHLHEHLATMTTNRALGAAIERARDAGAPASLWAPFTHFGA